MQPISITRGRHFRRLAVLGAALALTVPLVLSTTGASASATGSAAAASPSCPWLNQSLPVSHRVRLLLSQMTLADKINMVTGAGFSEPYVFYISAIPRLCIPAIGEERPALGAFVRGVHRGPLPEHRDNCAGDRRGAEPG